jgi:DNA invertase Pin-like site-specific DNA recombinase
VHRPTRALFMTLDDLNAAEKQGALWHIVAAVAEQEASAISKRTKATLQAAKARDTRLGGRQPEVTGRSTVNKTGLSGNMM